MAAIFSSFSHFFLASRRRFLKTDRYFIIYQIIVLFEFSFQRTIAICNYWNMDWAFPLCIWQLDFFFCSLSFSFFSRSTHFSFSQISSVFVTTFFFCNKFESNVGRKTTKSQSSFLLSIYVTENQSNCIYNVAYAWQLWIVNEIRYILEHFPLSWLVR